MPLTIVQAAAFPFPSPQGSQVYVHGMSRALARRGHRVIVACYGHGLGEADPSIEVLRTPAPPGYRNLRAGPDWVKPWLDVALAARLVGVDADVIHAHNYEAPIAAYIARAVRGTPVVYNNHNTMGEELHRYFTSPLARRAAQRFGRWLDGAVPRRADAAVAISESAEPLLEELGCRDVTFIPPGVDSEELVGDGAAIVEELDLSGRTWVIYAGNPDAYQDLEVLVDAVASLDQLGLIMVSASPLEVWEGRAASIPSCRKRFVVTSSWDRVRNCLAAADMAALPRAVCSGYPIKLLNTLGFGLPTVACEGSARDIAGVVAVPNGDVEAFAEALAALEADAARRTELGEAGRRDIRERFTWDACAERLEAVYERVTKTR